MKVAIMQPYFLPYIGYFQLINAADVFVVYDNVEYTKKGWINRNRILVNGKDEFITLPLKKDSDFLHINQRNLAATFEQDKQKILRKIKECYRKAPNFKQTYLLIEEIFSFNNLNLFEFLYNSIIFICNHLEIKTKFVLSSNIDIDHNLKSEEKVLAICEKLKAEIYFNPIGGSQLYRKERFLKDSILLNFIKTDNIEYKQFSNEFISSLSIIDVLMFNEPVKVKQVYLNQYIKC
jgi:hypothetical protein